MVYKNIRATMKWWDPHTKKLKYCSSAKIDEHNNKLVKGWSLGSELIIGTNTSTLPTLQIDLSDHPVIKDNIFEVNVNFLPRGTLIRILSQYCEHHNLSYISQSENNIQCNHSFLASNRLDVWTLSIGRKEPTTVQQVQKPS